MRQQAWPFWKRAPGARTNTSPSGSTSHTRTLRAVPAPRARTAIVNAMVSPLCRRLWPALLSTSMVGGPGGRGDGGGGGGGGGGAEAAAEAAAAAEAEAEAEVAAEAAVAEAAAAVAVAWRGPCS